MSDMIEWHENMQERLFLARVWRLLRLPSDLTVAQPSAHAAALEQQEKFIQDQKEFIEKQRAFVREITKTPIPITNSPNRAVVGGGQLRSTEITTPHSSHGFNKAKGGRP